MEYWKDAAAKVPAAKRAKIMEMMKTGSTIGEARKAIDLPLMVVAQIVIEEYITIKEAACKSL